MFIDLQFVTRISGHLNQFTRKDQYVWNFRCPFCGDSKKNLRKARGYIYRRKTDLFYRCHNCSVSMTFGNFLKKIDHRTYSEYCLEKYKAGSATVRFSISKPREPKTPSKRMDSIRIHPDSAKILKSLGACLLSHPNAAASVRAYAKQRKIPETQWNRICAVEDFSRFKEFSPSYKDTRIPVEPVLLFPCLDRFTCKLLGVTGRSLDPNSKLRYLTLKVNINERLMYGVERIDPQKRVLVVEGPIDSLFLSNCVASFGTSFTSVLEMFEDSTTILIFDNQPRNKEVCKIIKRHIVRGDNVFIFPETVIEKDINEMILAGHTNIEKMINQNTFRNEEALLRFNRWTRV